MFVRSPASPGSHYAFLSAPPLPSLLVSPDHHLPSSLSPCRLMLGLVQSPHNTTPPHPHSLLSRPSPRQICLSWERLLSCWRSQSGLRLLKFLTLSSPPLWKYSYFLQPKLVLFQYTRERREIFSNFIFAIRWWVFKPLWPALSRTIWTLGILQRQTRDPPTPVSAEIPRQPGGGWDWKWRHHLLWEEAAVWGITSFWKFIYF